MFEKSIPVVGLRRTIRLFRGELHETLHEWMALGKEVIRLRLFRDIYMIHSPLLAKTILQKAQKEVYKGDFLSRRLARVFGEGILVSDNPIWLEHRRIMQPAFHRERVVAMGEAMQRQIALRLESWGHALGQDATLTGFERRLRSLSMETIGQAVGFRDNRQVEALLGIMEAGAGLISRSLPVDLPAWVPFSTMNRLNKLVRVMEEEIRKLLREHEGIRDSSSLVVMLEEGLAAEDSREKGRMIMDEIKTVLISGVFTVSDAILWAIIAIETHPAVKRRLLSELAGGQDRTYLQACLNESMRWHPSVWSVWYKARTDLEVDGYRIPRDGVIMINLYNIFRNPDVVPDADRFLPDRFLDTDPPWWFLPYGHGPRKCIGANLSNAYLMAFLEQFYRAFEVELLNASLKGQVKITHGPRDPLRLRLRKRRQDIT